MAHGSIEDERPSSTFAKVLIIVGSAKFYPVFNILIIYTTMKVYNRKWASVVNNALNAPSSFWLICPLRNFSI